ncbi:hypothetical protein HN924_00315 [Candidatus Woesearchaeota archaeon]|jgi:hypothetical protein|nr:hypothetical protein [Candidatus Woesearchaeota archaeon]MBT7062395.1 hypothetical protein [Candidatus Woesearchaeota archaeon]MBT7402193.1 hypothetical protein [Candidatus Woesearchaeota archaeon]
MVSLLSGVQFLKEFGIFTIIMPFMLVFTLTYGVLSYVKPFGDDKFINSILAFIIAFLSIQFMPILIFIQLIVPYLFGLFLVMIMILILFRFIGVKDDTMQSAVTHPGVYGVIIAVLLIGVFIFLSESFPELSVSNQESSSGNVLSGINTGSGGGDSGTNTVLITETNDGTTTVLPESSFDERQDLLRNTIFHPTILSLLVMFIVFGTATYMVTVVKVA